MFAFSPHAAIFIGPAKNVKREWGTEFIPLRRPFQANGMNSILLTCQARGNLHSAEKTALARPA